MGADKPNIVLYLSDDHGREYLGCYGNAVIRTPNLDALAARGARFTAAFTPAPTCAPSRSTLFSGLYPARHGAINNHAVCRADLVTAPARLRELGYRVVLVGKKHVRPEATFDFEYAPGLLPKREDHRRRYRSEGVDVRAVEEILSGHAGRAQPLCLVIADASPHVTWEPNHTYAPEALSLPPYMVDTPVTRRAMANYYQDITTMDGRVGLVDEMLRRHGYEEDTLLIYTTDHGAEWPHSKWTVYDAGIHIPFIARWNGRIAPGTVNTATISHVDFLPTLLEAAGGHVPAEMDGRSYLGTLLGRAGAFRDRIYAAHNRDGDMNVFPQRCVRTARYKYVRNLTPEATFTSHFTEVPDIPESHRNVWRTWVQRAATDPAAGALLTLIRHDGHPVEELYDLEADPHELDNRASDADLAPILSELRADLASWMAEQQDPGLV